MEPIHFYFLEGSNYTNRSLDWIVASSGNFKLLEDNQSNMFSDIFKGRGLGDGFFSSQPQLGCLLSNCLSSPFLFILFDYRHIRV